MNNLAFFFLAITYFHLVVTIGIASQKINAVMEKKNLKVAEIDIHETQIFKEKRLFMED